jgi:chromosomal replication initiation ATPase DnaA
MTADIVIHRAAAVFDVPHTAILSRSREPRAVWARQAVAYVLRWHGWGVVAIGTLLNRNHTTIVYATQQAEQRAVCNVRYALDLSALLGR